jgi:hypothetical protein
MPSPPQLLPEFFALLGTDLFLMLSLLTCLLDDRFPKALPYIYQVAALAGFGHLLISRDFLAFSGEYTRFAYCLVYLIVAWANIVAINIYLAAIKELYALAKVWLGAITFPATLISGFFVSQYASMQASLSPILQTSLLLIALAMGTGVSISLSHEIVTRRFARKKEVK